MQVIQQKTEEYKKEYGVSTQEYLRSIEWNEHEFTKKQLETMFVASCLRYLEGLTDINFLLELSEEVRTKQQLHFVSGELKLATEMLSYIQEGIQRNSFSATDTISIKHLVDIAQEVITSRKYLAS